VIPREGVESITDDLPRSALDERVIPREGVESAEFVADEDSFFPISCDPERGS